MAMQVGEAGGEEDTPMSDINTTPLVDVMLVLLIIFLIAVPIVLQSVRVELPKVRYQVTETKPENVNLSVREEDGQLRGLLGPDQDDHGHAVRAGAAASGGPDRVRSAAGRT